MNLLISEFSQSFVEKCAICLQDIISNGIQHEICLSNFHRDHLASWFVLGHQNCPYCKYPFDKDIIQDLNPKTHEELDRLRKIAEVFGSHKKKPIRTTPRVVHRKWILYLLRSVSLLPIALFALIIIYIFILSISNDRNNRVFLIAGVTICLSFPIFLGEKVYNIVSKKVIYQPIWE